MDRSALPSLRERYAALTVQRGWCRAAVAQAVALAQGLGQEAADSFSRAAATRGSILAVGFVKNLAARGATRAESVDSAVSALRRAAQLAAEADIYYGWQTGFLKQVAFLDVQIEECFQQMVRIESGESL